MPILFDIESGKVSEWYSHLQMTCNHVNLSGSHLQVACDHVNMSGLQLQMGCDRVNISGSHLSMACDHMNLSGSQLQMACDHVNISYSHLRMTRIHIISFHTTAAIFPGYTTEIYFQEGKNIIRNKETLLKLQIFGYVIMSNHIHLIDNSSSGELINRLLDFKKFTANKIIESIIEVNKKPQRMDAEQVSI